MARNNNRRAASKIVPDADEETSSTSSSEAADVDEFVDDHDGASEDSGSGSEEGDEIHDDDDDDDAMEASDSDDGDEEESEDDDDEDDDEEVDGENDDADGDDIGVSSSNNEQCTFDLTNLLAFNTHQINAAELYQKQQAKKQQTSNTQLDDEEVWYKDSPTITADSTSLQVNETLLLAKAAEGTTQLMRELWRLPKEKTDVGLLAKLPLVAETKLPRSLVSFGLGIVS